MTLLGEKYWKIEAAVDEKDPAAVDTVLPIFCPESIWQGEVPPAVGMRFAGFIWISARFLPEGPLEPLLTRADLLHTVDEKKRMSVGNDFLNFFDS